MTKPQQSLSSRGSVYEIAKKQGKEGDDIPVSVSFQIIKQFSEELYDNPRRAIEELVCNSYDAGATECHIKTPEAEEDELKVLDNGKSMDVKGLKWLWKVAESRKATKLDEKRIENNRQQIGKFGVGKLASFALGFRLTHVATKDGTTRVISVHQDQLRDADNKEDELFTVREFDENEAKEAFKGHFQSIPNPWEQDWDHWTLAVVSDIPPENKGNNLQPWHLKRMLPSAVPSRSDFTMKLNDEGLDTIEPPANVDFSIDITNEDFIKGLEDRLNRFWATRKNKDKDEISEEHYKVETTLFESPGDSDEKLAGISVPHLGNVHGRIEYYDDKLTTDKREQRDYDEHGFRVYVRGRLVNKNDITFGLDNLSHKTWIRFRSKLEIPGLDDDLRVQRDSTKDSLGVKIAKKVVRQTFNKVRQKAREEEDDDGDSLDRPFSDRLQLRSPWYSSHAIAGLVDDENTTVDMDEVDIRVTSLRPTDRAVEFDSDEASFLINDNHPLFDTLDRKGRFTKNFENAFSEILAARLLIHGYLRYNGADSDALAVSRQIFDSVLRSAAGSIGEDQLDYQLRELKDASEVGGTRFEKAIADIFKNIGLTALQEGGPDTHDGVVTILRTGNSNYRVSIEAKGSQGIVDHQQLSFDNVNRHRVEQVCDHAIVVAREFKTEGLGEKRSALLRNSAEEINKEIANNVSYFTTEAMEVFLRLHYAQPFTYSETISILKNKKHPNDVVDYVIDIWEDKPDDQLTRRILDSLHEFVEDDDTNPPGIGTLTAHPDIKGTPRSKITEKLEALDGLCDSVDFNPGTGTVDLDASPKTILEEVDEAKADAKTILQGPQDKESITDY